MSLVVDKFLRYISFDTQSEDEQEQQPSTQKQFALANVLADELRQMGAEEVTVDEHCYVFATIPAGAVGTYGYFSGIFRAEC